MQQVLDRVIEGMVTHMPTVITVKIFDAAMRLRRQRDRGNLIHVERPPHRQDVPLWWFKFSSLVQNEGYDEAVAWGDSLLELPCPSPEREQFEINLGWATLMTGDWEAADQRLTAVYERVHSKPERLAVIANLVLLYGARMDKGETAARLLAEGFELDRCNVPIHMNGLASASVRHQRVLCLERAKDFRKHCPEALRPGSPWAKHLLEHDDYEFLRGLEEFHLIFPGLRAGAAPSGMTVVVVLAGLIARLGLFGVGVIFGAATGT